MFLRENLFFAVFLIIIKFASIGTSESCPIYVELLPNKMVKILNEDELCECLEYKKPEVHTSQEIVPCDLQTSILDGKISFSATSICGCIGYATDSIEETTAKTSDSDSNVKITKLTVKKYSRSEISNFEKTYKNDSGEGEMKDKEIIETEPAIIVNLEGYFTPTDTFHGTSQTTLKLHDDDSKYMTSPAETTQNSKEANSTEKIDTSIQDLPTTSTNFYTSTNKSDSFTNFRSLNRSEITFDVSKPDSLNNTSDDNILLYSSTAVLSTNITTEKPFLKNITEIRSENSTEIDDKNPIFNTKSKGDGGNNNVTEHLFETTESNYISSQNVFNVTPHTDENIHINTAVFSINVTTEKPFSKNITEIRSANSTEIDDKNPIFDREFKGDSDNNNVTDHLFETTESNYISSQNVFNVTPHTDENIYINSAVFSINFTTEKPLLKNITQIRNVNSTEIDYKNPIFNTESKEGGKNNNVTEHFFETTERNYISSQNVLNITPHTELKYYSEFKQNNTNYNETESSTFYGKRGKEFVSDKPIYETAMTKKDNVDENFYASFEEYYEDKNLFDEYFSSINYSNKMTTFVPLDKDDTESKKTRTSTINDHPEMMYDYDYRSNEKNDKLHSLSSTSTSVTAVKYNKTTTPFVPVVTFGLIDNLEDSSEDYSENGSGDGANLFVPVNKHVSGDEKPKETLLKNHTDSSSTLGKLSPQDDNSLRNIFIVLLVLMLAALVAGLITIFIYTCYSKMGSYDLQPATGGAIEMGSK